MKFTEKKSHYHTYNLETIDTGQVFTFPNSNCIAMKVNLDEEELHYIYSNTVDFIDAIAMYDEGHYVFDDNGAVDTDWYSENEDELCGYIDLATGCILISHQDENVILLDTELIYKKI